MILNIVMYIVLRRVSYNFCTPKKAPKFPYPFDFTNSVASFELYDPRLYEEPIKNKLYPKEIQHIQYVLFNFAKLLNTGTTPKQSNRFIHPLLITKAMDFREMLKSFQIDSKFEFKTEGIDHIEGYLQYYGINSLNPQKYLQDYTMNRSAEQLHLTEKVRQKKQNLQEKLQEDLSKLSKKSEQTTKKSMEEIKNQITGAKHFQFLDKFINGVNYLTEKTVRKKKQFNTHVLVDRINCNMTSYYTVKRANKDQKHEFDGQMVTKWGYVVDRLESEDIIKSRKRVLIDFQLWNRGCFIPNKQYVPNI